jgi:hypothetical protein
MAITAVAASKDVFVVGKLLAATTKIPPPPPEFLAHT